MKQGYTAGLQALYKFENVGEPLRREVFTIAHRKKKYVARFHRYGCTKRYSPTTKFVYYALTEYSSNESFQHTIIGMIDVSGFLVKEKAINIPRMYYQSMHVLVIHKVPLPRLCVPALLGSECWPAVPADSYRLLGHLTTISCSS